MRCEVFKCVKVLLFYYSRSESQLSYRKVYKTILCKMITTEAGVVGDPQLFIKVALHKN